MSNKFGAGFVGRNGFEIAGKRGEVLRELLFERLFMMDARSRMLTRREAAAFLGVKPQTLAVWHITGKYQLPLVKVGRSVRYRAGDLEKWVASRTVGAVAPNGAAAGVKGGDRE